MPYIHTRRPVTPLLATLALAALLPACAVTDTAETSYLQGQLAADRGDFSTALAQLNAAINANPTLGLAYMARGDVLKTTGDYDKAADDFEKVTQLEPANFEAHYKLGLMHQYLNRFARAIRAYQKAVEIRPLDPEANMNLATVYAQSGDPHRGIVYAQRAVDGAPESPYTHANLGVLYAQINDGDKAIDALKRAIELNAEQPEVYLNLAHELMRQDAFPQAVSTLQNARKIKKTPAILERLGVALYKSGDPIKAEDAYREALDLDPDYYPAMNGLGVVLMVRNLKADDKDVELAREALAYWHRSLKINPDQPAIKSLIDKYGKHQP